ncbi:MAG: sigma-70 family RNA polymerase sigma factor [Planctomycetaceae bacterium]|jgi:RNA polymerase sigma factor (sigma-70 family)|nr:sigma-70 family RNA polymerase sigma factor [Planctomycetaceae bacterium]
MKPIKKNLDKLIEEHQLRLKSFIRKRVANKEDADDVFQDVFYQLTKAVNTAINPIENVAAWLCRVAKNIIINRGKKKHESEMPVYFDEGGDILDDFSEYLFANETPLPEVEYLRSTVWLELENALGELPSEQREIFELTEFDDVPVKIISEATGVPVNTLLSRKHYAVLHLRKRLAKLYEEILCS